MKKFTGSDELKTGSGVPILDLRIPGGNGKKNYLWSPSAWAGSSCRTLPVVQ